VAALYFENLAVNYLDAGLEIHFQSLSGSGLQSTEWFVTIPVLATVGYRFRLGKVLYLRPRVSGGLILGILRYDPDGIVIGANDPEYENLLGVQLQVGSGVVFGSKFKRVFMELGAQYNLVIGSSKLGMILPVWASIGLNL
jgi:hypothetical protein